MAGTFGQHTKVFLLRVALVPEIGVKKGVVLWSCECLDIEFGFQIKRFRKLAATDNLVKVILCVHCVTNCCNETCRIFIKFTTRPSNKFNLMLTHRITVLYLRINWRLPILSIFKPYHNVHLVTNYRGFDIAGQFRDSPLNRLHVIRRGHWKTKQKQR